MPTKRQKEVLDYIRAFVKKRGVSPSLEEIAAYLELSSVSTAHYHVRKLQNEGYLERISNRPRSISIYINQKVLTPFLKKIEIDSVRIPVLGAANAGQATLLAEESVMGYLKIPRSALNRKNKIFALRIEGDSMDRAKVTGNNLEEGDFVLIDPEYRNPRNGDYVLSVIDGCANLKRFRRDERGNIMLISESTNPRHKPIYVSSKDDYMVNGKIIGVIKR